MKDQSAPPKKISSNSALISKMWLIKYVFETFKTVFAFDNRPQRKELKVALQVLYYLLMSTSILRRQAMKKKIKRTRPFEVIGSLAGCFILGGLFWSPPATHVLRVALAVEKGSHICPRVSLLALHRPTPSSRIKQVCKRDPGSMSAHQSHHLAPVCFLSKWRWLLSRVSNGPEIYWVAPGFTWPFIFLQGVFAQQQVLKQH